jgi:Uma2 family endonuclease
MTVAGGSDPIVGHAGPLLPQPRTTDTMAMPLAAHRFTVDEYHRMGQAGVFHEDDRVELIDGQVVEMSPIGPRHAACVDRLNRLLSERVSDRAVVRVQNPIVLGRHAAPQPDVALLRPPIERYADTHPEPPDILLVIEVADTSADYDRAVKLPLYARAGIPEAWLVNLAADTIDVFREPRRGGYAALHTARRGETLTALGLPGGALRVDDILG